MTSGTAPPTKKTERQPKSGISHSATKPPTAAPAVKPTVMPIVSVTRLRLGLNSPTSAVAFGMMQPRPSPEMSRSHSSCSTFCAKPVAIVRTENQSVAPMITGRRPILSASMLKSSDPMSTPTLAAAKTGPSAGPRHAEVARARPGPRSPSPARRSRP